MTNFVILRIAADGIYEHVGKNAKGYETRGDAFTEIERLLRLDSTEKGTQLAIFELEDIYGAKLMVCRI